MSPYDITRPGGIESTTSSTWLAKSSTGGAPPSRSAPPSCSPVGSEVTGVPPEAAGPAEQGQPGGGRADERQRGQGEQRAQDQLGGPRGRTGSGGTVPWNLAGTLAGTR